MPADRSYSSIGYDTEKLIGLMTRIAKLEEEQIENSRRLQQIDALFDTVSDMRTELSIITVQINSTLKTGLVIFGIVSTMAAGFWTYHNSQTTELQHEISMRHDKSN